MMAYAILSRHDLFGAYATIWLTEDNVDALNELEEMDLIHEFEQGAYTPTAKGCRALSLPEDSIAGRHDGTTTAPPVRDP